MRTPAKRPRARALLTTLALLALAAVALPAAASALSEGRVYEMVSPLFKGGYGASLEAVSPNGENVVIDSLGSFAGTPRGSTNGTYLAHREIGKGWTITPLVPPFPVTGTSIPEFSSTLEYGLTDLSLNDEGTESEYLLHRLDTLDTPENWEAFGGGALVLKVLEPGPGNTLPGGALMGASGNLCHLVIEAHNLLPEAPFVEHQSYEPYDLARGCGGEAPSLRLLGVRNSLGPNGEPAQFRPGDICNIDLGNGGARTYGALAENQLGMFNAVSGDGSEIFFTTAVEPPEKPQVCNDPQLFVRVGGSRTVEVSRPVEPSLPFGGCGEGGGAGEAPGEVPCPGAVSRAPAFFKGASEDGSRVFFTSRATLVPGDADDSTKLYMATIGCPGDEPGCGPEQRRVTSMVDASKSQLPGENAEVQGVVSMGRQANYVYFVAHGVLTATGNSEGVVAVKGADNLYAYDSETGSIAFIGDLCSGASMSGDSETVRCPSSLSPGEDGVNDTRLWGRGSESQATPDGRYLVFSSFARLIEHGSQADTDSAQDVYRYDAETGVLDRVSLGENGHDTNGNDSAFSATITGIGVIPGVATVVEQQGLGSRAISEDGSRIVFRSAGPLSVDAINGQQNVYIWHKEPGWSEGRVSLISSGSSLTDDFGPVITADGMNVFFNTSQGLVAGDTEHDVDVYDARVDGGFPPSGAEREPCSSDACQGALTNPAPLLVPGSISQAPGQNYQAPPAVKTVKKKLTKKGKTKKAKGTAKRKAGRDRRKGRVSGRSRTTGVMAGARSGR